MHFPTIITLLFVLAGTAVAQRGEGGECKDDSDCIRCVNGITPLICKTDTTSTTGWDETDLSKFLKQPTQPMIKVVGNGHSFGNMTTCVDVSATNRSSYMVRLTNQKDMQIRKDNNTVNFGAG
ncbi:putative gluconolactone oxidase [Diaporthe ampelina]|uniref:Putative gluconolactone oxidase n=1 Tax=Diaporthe ampelina TaxID=1214573 RepID=A0A0G2FM92_9PEZI|nr:putative gluconolactone oxidase [Diaporthe ampelina]